LCGGVHGFWYADGAANTSAATRPAGTPLHRGYNRRARRVQRAFSNRRTDRNSGEKTYPTRVFLYTVFILLHSVIVLLQQNACTRKIVQVHRRGGNDSAFAQTPPIFQRPISEAPRVACVPLIIFLIASKIELPLIRIVIGNTISYLERITILNDMVNRNCSMKKRKDKTENMTNDINLYNIILDGNTSAPNSQ